MNLLLTGCFNYTESQKEELTSLGYQIHFMQQEMGSLPLVATEVDAVVCNGLFLYHNIDEFSNLKFIQLISAGFDRVPVDYIKSRGILLHNARGVYSVPMAEWALFRVLEYYKRGWFFHKEQEANRWTKHRGLRELAGKKVAVVGAGNVGQEVARRFRSMGAVTVGFDVHTNATDGFDKMLLTSTLLESVGEMDVVVVTAPLLPSTRGLISREVLMAMNQDAMLVNIARGAIVDQRSLAEVLSERKDLFAALDVFEEEPLPADNALWGMENVAVSPHNSFVGDGNNARMFDVIYRNLKNFVGKDV